MDEDAKRVVLSAKELLLAKVMEEKNKKITSIQLALLWKEQLNS